MRAIMALLVTLVLSHPLWAQDAPHTRPRRTQEAVRVQAQDAKNEGCRAHVLVMDRSAFRASLSADQLKWWLEEGQKKFKGVCLATSLETADYVVFWAEKSENYTYEYNVPKTETTQHTGTVNGTSTGTSSTGTSNTVYTSGTYSGTSTKTTYEKEQTEVTIRYVVATVHKTGLMGGQKEIAELPVFVSEHKGQWRWSKPDKDALVKSLRYIARETK